MFPLATSYDFEARYGRSLDGDEELRVETLLSDASALVCIESGTEWTVTDDDDVVTLGAVPVTVVAVVCEAARRAFDNPAGLQSETIGDYTWRAQLGASTAGVFLTAEEKRIVRRSVGRNGLGAITMTADLLAPATDPLLGIWGNEENFDET